MSKQEDGRDNRKFILELASKVGVITQKQLIQMVTNLGRPNIQQHIKRLKELGHLREFPGRHYYGGSTGRPSAVYKFTEEGAAWLVKSGKPNARACGLKSDEARD